MRPTEDRLRGSQNRLVTPVIVNTGPFVMHQQHTNPAREGLIGRGCFCFSVQNDSPTVVQLLKKDISKPRK